MNMTRVTKALLIAVSFLLICCSPDPRKVVEKKFPQCFNSPIGADQGAVCEKEDDEWHVTFWHGFGDCASGCIHKEDTAWYLVNAKGEVWKTDKNFKPIEKPGPDHPIDKGRPSFQKVPKDSVSKNPQKLVAKPPDKKDSKKTIWLGRSVVVPQCMSEDELRQMTREPVFGATILERSFSPPKEPGAEFKKIISRREKQRYEADPDEFMCEACRVCSTMVRHYIKIYEKDADKFLNRPGNWLRVEE